MIFPKLITDKRKERIVTYQILPILSQYFKHYAHAHKMIVKISPKFVSHKGKETNRHLYQLAY